MASKNTKDTRIDPNALRIVDEAYTDGRATQATKYDAFFQTVPPNKRIQCPQGKAGGLASSFRKWLEKHGNKDAVVRSRERCVDGMGGVWWIKGAKKPCTVWAGIGDIGKKAA